MEEKGNYKRIERAHGIMFHHFHSEDHIRCQGSISANELEKLLIHYKKEHDLISADEFHRRAVTGELKSTDVCLTFDDGLRCQYDVAIPVLKRHNLKAFWFVYTSPLHGIAEKLEIYHDFRFSEYRNIDAFYGEFFSIAEKSYSDISEVIKTFDPTSFKKNSPFYTKNDRLFRYLRDEILGSRYDTIMTKMMLDHGYIEEERSTKLWMNKEQIKDLAKNGHIIGLHSYTHPTVITKLSYDEQLKEYIKNKQDIESLIGKNVFAVAYPCGYCNDDTKKAMKELGIEIGFMADTAVRSDKDQSDKLQIPREDHSNILREMRQ